MHVVNYNNCTSFIELTPGPCGIKILNIMGDFLCSSEFVQSVMVFPVFVSTFYSNSYPYTHRRKPLGAQKMAVEIFMQPDPGYATSS